MSDQIRSDIDFVVYFAELEKFFFILYTLYPKNACYQLEEGVLEELSIN